MGLLFIPITSYINALSITTNMGFVSVDNSLDFVELSKYIAHKIKLVIGFKPLDKFLDTLLYLGIWFIIKVLNQRVYIGVSVRNVARL